MKKLFIVFVLLILINGPDCFALDKRQKAFQMDEVLVTSTNKAKAFDTPASLTIITAKDLEDTGAKSVIEALEKIPGIINKTYNNDSIAIRGIQSSMAGGPVILIDGVPQKIGNTQYDCFNFIPVSQIERIEVLRSPGIVYGPGSSRGVINIITKKGGDQRFSGDVKFSYGSWNTMDTSATISGNQGKFDYMINGGASKSDGYEDEASKRTAGLAKFGYNLNQFTRLGIKGNIIDSEDESCHGFVKKKWQLENYRRKKHFPVSPTDPRLYWHNEKEQKESVFALSFAHDNKEWFMDSNLSWTGYKATYKSMNSLYTKPKRVYTVDKDQDTYTFTLSGGKNFVVGNLAYTPSFGLNLEKIDYDQGRIYPYNPKKNTDRYFLDVKNNTHGFFFDNDLLFQEKYGLKIGARMDHVNVQFKDRVPTKVDQTETLTGWSLAPSYHFTPDANIYFQISRNFWMPTPAYYAWAAVNGTKGGVTINSPDSLKPEQSTTYELGYKHMVSDGFNLILTTFYIDYKDKFAGVYHTNAAMSWGGVKNVGSAKMKGLELEIDGRPMDFFGYRFSGTYLDAKWDSGQMRVFERPGNKKVLRNLKGYRINGIPEYYGSFGVDLYPLPGFKLSGDINYCSSYYADYTNRIKYNAKTTFDAKISYSINKQLDVWLLGKNIFNRKIEKILNTSGKINKAGEYDNAYYVQDGAYVEVGITYRF